jgi:cell division protein FtsZ
VPEQKKGWMSLCGGRPRYDAAPAYPHAPRSAGAAAPAAQPREAEPDDHHDDLEIPSFLRRLAN